jgi:hypothetical protein
MYLGFALFLGTIMYFIMLIVPFMPKLRKFGINFWGGSIVGEILRSINDGVESWEDAIALSVGYIGYMILNLIAIGFIALIWPVILIIGLLSLIIYKTNKNK